jgi:hypothetical protein
MNATEQIENIRVGMDDATGELMLRYERYIPGVGTGTGWVRYSRTLSTDVFRTMQDNRAAIAARNPDMEPEAVTLTMLKRWALTDIETQEMGRKS